MIIEFPQHRTTKGKINEESGASAVLIPPARLADKMQRCNAVQQRKDAMEEMRKYLKKRETELPSAECDTSWYTPYFDYEDPDPEIWKTFGFPLQNLLIFNDDVDASKFAYDLPQDIRAFLFRLETLYPILHFGAEIGVIYHNETRSTLAFKGIPPSILSDDPRLEHIQSYAAPVRIIIAQSAEKYSQWFHQNEAYSQS